MEASSEFCSFAFRFNGLPKHVTVTKSTGCLNDVDANSTKVPVTNALFSNRLLLAFSQAPSWSVSFPRMFFDRDGDNQYESNVKGFLAFFESWLLGLNIGTLSAKPISDDSGDKNGYNNNIRPLFINVMFSSLPEFSHHLAKLDSIYLIPMLIMYVIKHFPVLMCIMCNGIMTYPPAFHPGNFLMKNMQ